MTSQFYHLTPIKSKRFPTYKSLSQTHVFHPILSLFVAQYHHTKYYIICISVCFCPDLSLKILFYIIFVWNWFWKSRFVIKNVYLCSEYISLGNVFLNINVYRLTSHLGQWSFVETMLSDVVRSVCYISFMTLSSRSFCLQLSCIHRPTIPTIPKDCSVPQGRSCTF